MDDGAVGRVEKFNQAIRGVVVLLFTGTICYGFVVSKVVSTETMAVMASTAFTWWFSNKKDEEKKPPAKNGATPPPAP